ncbi:MAG: PIG-L family deacetylase [Actinobacteria bacterium]|nr:PIG-L family deacetylase [Actinomycetota bacterium]
MYTTERSDIVEPERLLVVCAHPDDVDFGASGTVASLTDAGAEVSYCLVTSGEAGSDHLALSGDELSALREEEQAAAAKEVGVSDLHFLRHRDGALQPTLELRRDISRVIRRVRPNVLLTQSPERMLERVFASHPDHLAAGEAALCAVYPDARNPRAFPELLAEALEPHTVAQVWLMAHREADLRVDITDQIDRKIAALRAHASQTDQHPDLDGMIRGWAAMNAEAGGLAEGRLAEAFKVVPTA